MRKKHGGAFLGEADPLAEEDLVGVSDVDVELQNLVGGHAVRRGDGAQGLSLFEDMHIGRRLTGHNHFPSLLLHSRRSLHVPEYAEKLLLAPLRLHGKLPSYDSPAIVGTLHCYSSGRGGEQKVLARAAGGAAAGGLDNGRSY
eukprot:760704-Hanusia_phi.AAC.2